MPKETKPGIILKIKNKIVSETKVRKDKVFKKNLFFYSTKVSLYLHLKTRFLMKKPLSSLSATLVKLVQLNSIQFISSFSSQGLNSAVRPSGNLPLYQTLSDYFFSTNQFMKVNKNSK